MLLYWLTTEEVKVKIKDYGINAVPTTIIDGKIKVVCTAIYNAQVLSFLPQ